MLETIKMVTLCSVAWLQSVQHLDRLALGNCFTAMAMTNYRGSKKNIVVWDSVLDVISKI